MLPSVNGIFQARVLEWAAISFSRRSPQPRDQTQVSCTANSLNHQGSPKFHEESSNTAPENWSDWGFPPCGAWSGEASLELRPGGCLLQSTSAQALGEDWVAWPVTGAEEGQVNGERQLRGDVGKAGGGRNLVADGARWARGETNRSREETVGQIQLSSVPLLSRVRICYPMNRSTSGLPVLHQLPESTQTRTDP